MRCARPGGPPRGGARGRRRSPIADRGGVSRPSSSAWTRTAGTPWRGGELGDRDEVAVVGVDAARPDQADEVEAAARPGGPPARLEQGRALEEAAVGDRGVDPRQVLEDGPAGAQVEVADLGVAHLAGRQADRVLGRARGPRAASRAGGRARSASGPRRSHRSPGRRRSRTRRGRRGRSGAAGRAGSRPRRSSASARPVTRPRRGRRRSARPGPRSRPSRRP